MTPVSTAQRDLGGTYQADDWSALVTRKWKATGVLPVPTASADTTIPVYALMSIVGETGRRMELNPPPTSEISPEK